MVEEMVAVMLAVMLAEMLAEMLTEMLIWREGWLDVGLVRSVSWMSMSKCC